MKFLKDAWSRFKANKRYAVLCPFHHEKTPSCIVDPKTNTFHCYGCKAEGQWPPFKDLMKRPE